MADYQPPFDLTTHEGRLRQAWVWAGRPRFADIMRACDVSWQTVNNWFKGKAVGSKKGDDLLALSRFLGVSMVWLQSGDGEPRADTASGGMDEPVLIAFLEHTPLGKSVTEAEADALRHQTAPAGGDLTVPFLEKVLIDMRSELDYPDKDGD